jgi:hypothetical protein
MGTWGTSIAAQTFNFSIYATELTVPRLGRFTPTHCIDAGWAPETFWTQCWSETLLLQPDSKFWTPLYIEQTNMLLLPLDLHVFTLSSSPNSEGKKKWYYISTYPYVLTAWRISRSGEKCMSFYILTLLFLNKSARIIYEFCKWQQVSRSEIARKFWNVVLEKDEEDQLDRSCEKRSITKSQGRISYMQ